MIKLIGRPVLNTLENHIKSDLNISYICYFKDRNIYKINKFIFTFRNSKNEILSILLDLKDINKTINNHDYLNFDKIKEIEDLSFSLICITINIICNHSYNDLNEFYSINKVISMNNKINIKTLITKYNNFIKNIV